MDCFIFTKELKKDALKSFKRAKYCRFKASDRLKFYSAFSNWVFTLLSLLLILATLIDIYGILNSHEKILDFYEISLAITILVFFQVISNSKYETRALRFHQCGIEISQIIQKLEHIQTHDINDAHNFDEKSIDRIKKVFNEYTSILKRYENHDTVDYLEYVEDKHKYETKLEKTLYIWLNIRIFITKYVVALLPQWTLIVLSFLGFYFSFDFLTINNNLLPCIFSK